MITPIRRRQRRQDHPRRGGHLRQLQPLSRGNPGIGTDTLYDGLFTTSDDEPGSYYPLIAESARYPSDYHWMEVSINPHAQFQDGTPITAQDVAFTFSKFMTEGVPQFRVAFRGVQVKALNRLTVRIEMPKPDKDRC